MSEPQATQYNTLTKVMHWLSALVIFGLFGLGYWMMDLDYYSEWYQTAPHWHQSIGILLFIVTVVRLVWRKRSATVTPLSTHSKIEVIMAKVTHALLYGLLLVIMLSGYLITTADGRAIEVFDWFSIPALGSLFGNQEDIAGEIHEIAAYIVIALALIHAAAALKHHFIEKDSTLKRMLFGNQQGK